MLIYIITCKYGYYLSIVLRYILLKENYEVQIKEDINLKDDNLHIILFSQKVKTYPRNYIIYNLEQKNISKWIDKKYELSLLFSKKCWDYSFVNIYKFHKLIQDKMIYFKLPCIEYSLLDDYNENNIEEFDVLFYGTMNKSRIEILNIIQMNLGFKYHIKIINNIFGKELFNYIKKCKIVLNISYYKNALLECYRINEVQSCKKLVISFFPNIEDSSNYHYYKDSVVFVKTLNNMISNINYYLENKIEYDKKIESIKFLENTKFIHDIL